MPRGGIQLTVGGEMLSALEPRVLLSSVLKSGVLSVTGNSSNNTITLSLVRGKIRVAESGLASKDYTTASITKILVNAKEGNDTVTVSSSITKNCEIQGGKGNDTIRGGGGVDALLGQDGDDNLEGGAKNDYIDGGKGSDRVDYSSRTSSVRATLKYDGTTDKSTGSGGGTHEADAFASIESLSGTGKGDSLMFEGSGGIGSSLARTFRIDGLGGNDTIEVSAINVSSKLSVLARGGNGDDKLSYFSFQQVISLYGEGGNDKFSQVPADTGGGPIAARDGGSGYDVDDFWDNGNVKYVTPPGVEEAFLDFWNLPSIDGNGLNNKLHVSFGFLPGGASTAINGMGGDDFIEVSSYGLPRPAKSNVPIHGGSGNDSIEGCLTGESLYGDSGNDVIYGDMGDDFIDGGSGNDIIDGGLDNDTLIGGSGRDQLFGGADKDFLKARDGEKDTLDGGSGTDKAERDASLDVLTSIETVV
jgi:Ca2+-binding RTX toxin-like protein